MKIKSTKLLAILLAVCMMFSFSSVVFAANLPAGMSAEDIYGIFQQMSTQYQVGLLDGVYGALKDEGLLDDVAAFKTFYDKVDAAKGNERALEALFEKSSVEKVVEDTAKEVEDAAIDVKELTGVVANGVVNSNIDVNVKAEIVDKVVENLGNANVGVAIPAKLMEVYNYLSVNKYIDAAQKLALMQLAVDVLNGKEVNYEKAASTLYDILAANKNISLAEIVEIVKFVFDLYEEEIADVYAKAFAKAKELGLVDKAVKVLELADSKLAEAAEIVKTDLTGMALADELLKEIRLADATFSEIIIHLENGSEFKKVLELRGALAEQLDIIKTISNNYEHTETGLAKLIGDVRALYDAALEATYLTYEICGGTVDYVALGGTVSFNTKYAETFATELAKELPSGIYNGTIKCKDLTKNSINTSTVAKYIDTNKNDIANADLITFNMDAIDALVNIVGIGNLDENAWAAYNFVGSEATALAEKAIAKLEVLLAERFDAGKVAEVRKLAEKLVYTVVSYGVESYKALETIIGLNDDAQIIVLGMVNPFKDVSVKYGENEEDQISLYELFDLVIEATDIYNGIYAMFSENVTFVSVADAEKEYDYSNDITIDITAGDDISDLSEVIIRNLDSTNYADAFALKKTNIVNALLTAIDFVGIKHIDEKPVDNKCDRCGAPLSTPNPFVPSGPSAPVHFNCDGGENCYCNKYTDLDNTMWYHQGVCYMIEHGYMIGIGDGKWAPEQIITRAEIATILWRIAGSEEVNYALDFSDVEADMWYTEAIEWAVSEEIFLGYGDGKFGPNDQITREQLVLVMYRYELDNGKKITADFDMTTVSDADEISEWAVEAMTWALDCGLIIGTDVDVLTASPLKTATRAEVAMIFYRKLDNLLK